MKCGWNNDFVFIDGKNQMNRTVLTDVKLLCDSQDITNYTSEALTRYQDFSTFLAALSKCFFMIGYFIGGLIFGTVADAEGRWVCFLKQSMFWHFIFFFQEASDLPGDVVLRGRHRPLAHHRPHLWHQRMVRILTSNHSLMNCAFQGSRNHNDRSWSRHHRSLPHGLHHQVWFPSS